MMAASILQARGLETLLKLKVALMLLQNYNSKRTLYAKAKLFSSI
jgi:hypothetical protein